MRNRPRTVRISGTLVPVDVDTTADEYGSATMVPPRIEVRRYDLSDPHWAGVVFHEALHIILYRYGVMQGVDDDEVEERIVTVLETAIPALLRDNPKLLKALLLEAKQ
jgi:hypothetical protein